MFAMLSIDEREKTHVDFDTAGKSVDAGGYQNIQSRTGSSRKTPAKSLVENHSLVCPATINKKQASQACFICIKKGVSVWDDSRPAVNSFEETRGAL